MVQVFLFEDYLTLLSQPFISVFWEVSRPSGEGICFSILFPWSEGDGEVEARKGFPPSGLVSIQLLRCPEVIQVLEVGENFDGVKGAFQFRSQFLEHSYDGEELFVVDLVVAFRTPVGSFGYIPRWWFGR